ncbi:hypothetical protein F5148DRAFT_52238 [Russula earlei]|uniref:Uncharacterized protein n=1 Tax=Russula earlei TaxID=71964 RepID=A0ACC0UKE0_9AGAM|nr:hypothetical protein F5148DRAFT_52238 [Russula earlei]
MIVSRGIVDVASLLTAAAAMKGSSEDMWARYMKEVKEHDTRITDAWKEDANALVVFTGLFSAIVGAFIIESYKKLSPDSGDQTVYLLGQISQQLTNFMNGTLLNPPLGQQFSPDISIICVNTLWVSSLVLSVTSALFATLLQQWSRRYIQMPYIQSMASEQARVRSFLFLGTQKYKIRLAVETPQALLNVSVFLFFTGLVVFFFKIHQTVAIVVSISVGLFATAYFTATILPCVDHMCPYRTPISNIWWYPWHASLALATLFLRWLVAQFRDCLVPDGSGEVRSFLHNKLLGWLNVWGEAIKKRRDHLKRGFGKSIIQGALDAPVDVDRKALTWLFSHLALADNTKLPQFVANIPRDEIVKLMTPPLELESGKMKMVFREHLLTLLHNCAFGTPTIGLEEQERKNCLLVCLGAIHHITKTLITPHGYSRSDESILLNDLRTDFAKSSLMQVLWVDPDAAIRVISRSICALLARRLVTGDRFEESDLRWIHDVTGEPQSSIYGATHRDALDHVNRKSFVYGILSDQEGISGPPNRAPCRAIHRNTRDSHGCRDPAPL